MTVFEDAKIDAIRELINIGIGRAAEMLNQMTKSHIKLQVPDVRIIHITDLESDECRYATVKLGFQGSFSGTAALVFPPESAAVLVTTLTGEEAGTPELDVIRAETLKEVGNIIINGVMGSISNVLKERMRYSIPTYMEDRLDHLFIQVSGALDDRVVVAKTHFLVEELDIEGNIILIMELGSLDVLLSCIQKAGA